MIANVNLDVLKRLLSDATATGAGDGMKVRGASTVSFQVTNSAGTFSLKPQGTVDGSNWIDLPFKSKTTGAYTLSGGTTSSTGTYEADVAGLSEFRLNVTAESGATLNAYGVATANTSDARAAKMPTLTNPTITATTDVQVFAAAAREKLLALMIQVEGTGTTDVRFHVGTASTGTRIARYRNTSVPAPNVPIDLFPGLAAAGGINISTGLFMEMGSNKNTAVKAQILAV